MQAQKFESKHGYEHKNSTNFVSNVISPASNLLLLLETHDQFVQNEDPKVFHNLHLQIAFRKATKKFT